MRQQASRVRNIAERRQPAFRNDDFHFLIRFTNDYGSIVTQKFLREVNPTSVLLLDKESSAVRNLRQGPRPHNPEYLEYVTMGEHRWIHYGC